MVNTFYADLDALLSQHSSADGLQRGCGLSLTTWMWYVAYNVDVVCRLQRGCGLSLTTWMWSVAYNVDVVCRFPILIVRIFVICIILLEL